MSAVPKKQLTVYDCVCVIVGIIIGAGIYETSPFIAFNVGSAAGVYWIWIIGGVLVLSGALCYAELATAYPKSGGDYVYLTRAYGRPAGYMFGWSQLAIIRPGDIALMAFVFATYAQELFPTIAYGGVLYAAWAVAALTLINIIGVSQGKWTQNVLTTVKVLGVLAIIVAGLMASSPEAAAVVEGANKPDTDFRLALILVLFVYGGWHEMAYVAAEVKNPNRNIVRAILLGSVGVIVLYLLMNFAFLRVLGYQGMTSSGAVASDVVGSVFGQGARGLVSALICISALGAINGLTFTGARVAYALGSEHASFRPFGKWDERRGTPVRSLLLQGAIALAIIVLAGSFIDTILYAAPVVWVFFLLTAISMFVLRKKDASTERPYKAFGYPLTPIIFIAACAFMLHASVTYAWAVKPKSVWVLVGVMVVGAVVFLATNRRDNTADSE